MKKNIIITTLSIILLSIFIIPNNVYAEVEVTNLKEAVDEEVTTFGSESSYKEAVEKLESYDLSNYKDDDKKVNVYIFRGSTCSHCFDAIDHFASIYKDEGKYFNVKTYEVWSNEDNNELMEKVAEKLGDEVSGVPYIVIGKKSWSGYASNYDEEIMNTIKEEYNKDKKNDVVTEITNGKDSNDSITKDVIAVIVIVLVVAGVVIGIIMARKNTTK